MCPCGSNKHYDDCCGKYISGDSFPETPEALMRSRYTAYTQANIDYIVNTMEGPALMGFDPISAKEWALSIKWLKLEVLKAYLENATQGFVEFRAHYKIRGKKEVLYELSEFHYRAGRWYYYTCL